jgi:hypothetical protein
MSTNLTTLPVVAQVVETPRPNNLVTIQIGDDDCPIRMQVFFLLEFTDVFHRWQNVTVCGIRYMHREINKAGNVHYRKSVETFWGNAMQNPKDYGNLRRGRQVAFRRAFAALVRDELEISDPNVIVALYGEARKAMFHAGAW